MDNFKTWLEQQEFVEFATNAFDAGVASSGVAKPWSAKKDQIIQIWKQVQPQQPIIMTPMPPADKDTDGTSYGEDGVRITGTWQFIAGVLGRLKEILAYENPTNKLRLVLRGVDSTKSSKPDRQSYVFYVNLQPRSHVGRKKTPGF